MVTTHSEEEWRLLKSLRNQGRADSGGWLEHARLGFNYRLDDVARRARHRAAREARRDPLAAAQAAAERYTSMLEERARRRDAARRTTPTTSARGSSTSSRSPAASTARRSSPRSSAAGVGTARYLPCIHLQPYMRERYGFAEGLCPVAEDVAARTLALPFHTRHRRRPTRSARSRCSPGALGVTLAERIAALEAELAPLERAANEA